MKTNFKSIAVLFALGALVVFSSCKEDDPIPQTFARPSITGLEVGENNTKEAKVGEDLHVDAEIVAEGTISKIKLELHPETGSGDDIEAEYTEYAGLKNVDFHKDLDIPSTADTGEYHFHLEVIDEQGQTTKVEADVEITK